MAPRINVNEILETRLSDDGKSLVHYTRGQFRDDVLRDRTQIAINKFWHLRDDWQKDTLSDSQRKRRGKRYSFTRDSIEGPREKGFSAFGAQRFFDEVDALVRRGVMSAVPDVYDDDSMKTFFMGVQARLSDGSPEIAQRLTDAAPSVYVFTELMKRTEILIEEELTRLWARQVFPVRNLNTWLPVWNYKRVGNQSPGLPQYVDYDEVPSDITRKRERVHPIVRKLVFFDEGASWTQHELWVAAEAVANGATNLQLDTRRVNVARRGLMWKENVLAFFGDPEVNIIGLMSPETGEYGTGIERIPATTQLGSGTSEADRRLLIDTVMAIIDNTEDIFVPNMVGLPTKAFLHIIARRYGTTDNPSDQTVAQAALVTLREVGITSFTQIPELGFRQGEATRLQKLGVEQTEAERLAGGIFDDGEGAQVDVMLVARRDPEVMEMILAKDITMYPAAEVVRGKTEIRMVQGCGGVEFYQPEAVKLVTNITGEDTLNYTDPV